jgi:PAS domain S-box-containing protein
METKHRPPPDRSATVLVVDDEPGVLQLCQDYLAATPHRVLTAESGAEALKAVAAEAVDVVLSDYSMPGMSGAELLRRLRETAPAIVRILHTGVADMNVAEESVNEGQAFRFLCKPYRAATLRRAVEQALEHKRLVEENRRFHDEQAAQMEAQTEELMASQHFMDSLLEALPAGVVAIDARARVSLANPSAAAVLGLEPAAIMGQPAAAMGITCPDSPDCPEHDPRTQARANRVFELRDAAGLAHTLLWSCRTFRDGKGRPAGCVASFIDVTDKQELESRVFLAKQEIEGIFDALGEPLFLVDPELRVVRANRAVVEISGLPFREILGQPCGILFPGRDPAALEAPLHQVLATGQPNQKEFRTVDRLFMGYYFPILRGEAVGGVVARYQDVTAERQMEHQLLHSEKMAAIGQLSAGIAHEINNPVGFILSNLNRMAEYSATLTAFGKSAAQLRREVKAGERDPTAAWDTYIRLRKESDLEFLVEDVSDIVAECREGAERIRKIVMDLKTFSHPDTADLTSADLNQGLESTLNIVWNELKYHCEVVKELGEIPQILCHQQQINQVFMNLLVNGAHAIEERGVITLRTRAEGDGVAVSISDTGKGIPPENLGRIFEPFFTTKPAGKGTGLGLHLVDGIVRAHGGRIEVESTVGAGTTFTVRLPGRPPPAEAGGGDGDPR